MNRIMISGTNSGCGKTTVVCAVLKALVNRGVNVNAFKCGPDYIDPMFHSRIIGAPSRSLDSYFCDKNTLNCLLHKNEADLSVIEGAMGFYDGVGDRFSACQTAVDTGTPVVIVLDCKGIGISMGAVMKGFLEFRSPNNTVGFIFNRLPDSMVETAKKLCVEMHTEYFGRMPFSKENTIESRHLGLVTAAEIDNLKDKTERLAKLAEENILIDRLISAAEKAADMPYKPIDFSAYKIDANVKIAVAADSAFCFYYEDNLDLLRELGCEIAYFSPLHDNKLPDNVSGAILCGGYPELYAEQLEKNVSLLADIKSAIEGGMPVIAECGGFMYLHDFIEDSGGTLRSMVGIIRGKAYKTPKLQRFGYVELTAKSDSLLLGEGESVRAHEFHYWNSTDCGSGYHAVKASSGAEYDCVHSSKTMYAGYPHINFYANVNTAINFAQKCSEYSREKNEQD